MNDYIRKIRKNEIDKASKLLAKSFYNDPLYTYFFPNEKNRLKGAESVFAFELERAEKFTYVTDDISAVSVVKKESDAYSFAGVSRLFKLIFTVSPFTLFKLIKYLYFCDKMKKKHKPNNSSYLELICVDPKQRGKGLAKKSVAFFGDKDIYLETQNEQNLPFYGKMGFTLVKTERLSKSIRHYCMFKPKDEKMHDERNAHFE